MGFSFSMEGRNIALESPEQIDTLIQFLHLYKTLTLPKATVKEKTDSDHFASITPPVVTTAQHGAGLLTKERSIPEATEAQPTDTSAPDANVPTPLSRYPLVVPPPGERAGDYIVRVLSNSGVAMDSNDITNAMLAIGWSTTVESKFKRRHMIDSTLRRKKNQFIQLPDGKWTLVQTATPQTP